MPLFFLNKAEVLKEAVFWVDFLREFNHMSDILARTEGGN